MPATSRRLLIERIGLFLLGMLVLNIGALSSLLFDGAVFDVGLWPMIVAVVIAAVVSGLLEAASVRRTGRRRWVLSWLPSALGMVTLVAVQIAFEEKGPDSGLALSIVVFAFLIGIPIFALLVNLIAIVALRLSPAPAGTM